MRAYKAFGLIPFLFLLGCPAICQNGVTEQGEECDDGNSAGLDNCTPLCQLATCGDGFVFSQGKKGDALEACDDGNLISGDGCTLDCSRIEICGDGFVDSGEQCDDGNPIDGDFVSDFCDPNCTLAFCGNGNVGLQEEDFFPLGTLILEESCDDGNTLSGDGCNSGCSIEPGFECIGDLSLCDFVCGDGFVNKSEECDDGNTVAGDGCRADCGGIEVCGDFNIDTFLGEECDDGNFDFFGDCVNCFNAKCGDGIKRTDITNPQNPGFESCDDGNIINGDGCSSSCIIESTANGTCQLPFTAAVGSNSGSNIGSENFVEGSCQTVVQAGGGTGGDIVFRFTAPVSGTRTFTMTSNSDQGIILQSINSCGGLEELGCADIDFAVTQPPGDTETESLILSMVAGQQIFVIISSFAPGTESAFTVQIQ